MSKALSLLRPVVRQIHCLNASPVTSPFSTSATSQAGRRVNRDRNKLRGVSALRRQPKKIALAAAKFDLPEPELDMSKHKKLDVDPNHGLWGFFLDKKSLPTPMENSEHGRSWTVEELRYKSWEDLHKLWWVCTKELNIMATQKVEFERFKPGQGDHEARRRYIQVKNTQRGIKHVLTERHYAWKEALDLAQADDEVNLSGEGLAYNPRQFVEDVEANEAADATQSTPTKPTNL